MGMDMGIGVGDDVDVDVDVDAEGRVLAIPNVTIGFSIAIVVFWRISSETGDGGSEGVCGPIIGITM